MKISEKKSENVFISEGKVHIRDQEIPYQVISEEIMLDGKNSCPAASMFSFTYLRTDVKNPETRPVIFVYNGGPGSSSHLLHVGFFGPERAKISGSAVLSTVPPFEVEENPHCLLDLCDFVLIDPVGTGYAKLLISEATEEFFGVEQDASSFVLFIEDWLSRYDRWNSPRFICGESYGTMRSAVLADALMGGVAWERFSCITLNGIIMMGSTLHLDTLGEQPYVEPSVLNFISYAAANWYHHGLSGQLEKFVEEAYAFSVNEYARALLLGDSLSPEEREAVIGKLHTFTGLPKEYFTENGLRLETRAFLSNAIGDRGLELGAYDSRVSLPKSEKIGQRDSFDDPSMANSNPAYASLFHSHFLKKLNIHLDRPYITTNIAASIKWDWKCGRSPCQCLTASMRRNEKLRVMFASGLYDLCTCAGYARYVIDQLSLPRDRVTRREYEGGHMIYTREKAAAALAQDLRTFISESI